MYGTQKLGVNVSIEKSVKEWYSGEREEKPYQKNGTGTLTFDGGSYRHRYHGQFFSGNMHGEGEYKCVRAKTVAQWLEPPGKQVYEGKMYVNAREGYGRMSYPCNAVFEGLFRNDQRFGPGVYTSAVGGQDVGMWINCKLVRLATSLGDRAVPRIAVNEEDKIEMTKRRETICLAEVEFLSAEASRSLVPRLQRLQTDAQNSENGSRISAVLRGLVNCEEYQDGIKNRARELYNPLCRDIREPWFDIPKFDSAFYEHKTEYTIDYDPLPREEIRKIQAEEEFATSTSSTRFDGSRRLKTLQDFPTKKVAMSHFSFWNNGPLMIDLLKHAFKHQYSQRNVSCDIDQILTGRRDAFRPEGKHEKAALNLLGACSEGLTNKALRLITSRNVNVDVADNEGNSGLMFAAASDRIETMDTLLNFGADVDCINDECLTPLSLCVLRLLALVHGVSDWGRAFLRKEVDRANANKEGRSDTLECRKGISSSSLTQDTTDRMSPIPPRETDNMILKEIPLQRYIFDLTPVNIAPAFSKVTENSTANVRGPRAARSQTMKTIVEDKVCDDEIDEKKRTILATILKLLSRGANPNYPRMPYPVLIMALFARSAELISQLLAHGADPNVVLSEQDYFLTPLHILAVLEPTEESHVIAELLLAAKADASLRTAHNYRWDIQQRFAAGRSSESLENAQGFTALQLLAARSEFEMDVNQYLAALIRVIARNTYDSTECTRNESVWKGSDHTRYIDSGIRDAKYEPHQSEKNKRGSDGDIEIPSITEISAIQIVKKESTRGRGDLLTSKRKIDEMKKDGSVGAASSLQYWKGTSKQKRCSASESEKQGIEMETRELKLCRSRCSSVRRETAVKVLFPECKRYEKKLKYVEAEKKIREKIESIRFGWKGASKLFGKKSTLDAKKECHSEEKTGDRSMEWLVKCRASVGAEINQSRFPWVAFSDGDVYYRLLRSNRNDKLDVNYSFL